MSSHVFRNPDIYQELPFRQWIREYMPNGDKGFVAEDLDLVVRHFGEAFEMDGKGRFMLIEIKISRGMFKTAQAKTFSLIHELLRSADPHRERYIGFYVVHTTVEWPDAEHFTVNHKHKLTPREFRSFLMGELRIQSKFDDVSPGGPVVPSTN